MTNHTTPETSSEILRLCREKGVEPPEISENEWLEMFFEVSDLLMWSGWGDWSRMVEVHGHEIFALATPRGNVFAEHTTGASTVAEALGLLLIEYLRTL